MKKILYHEFEHHVGLLIFPQNTWKKKDKELIINSIEIRNQSKIYSEWLFYHDFILSPFQIRPHPDECLVCIAIKEYFKLLLVDNDYVFYINGPYLRDPHKEDNYSYLQEMIIFLIHNVKIKKVYFLYVNSIKDLGFKEKQIYNKTFSNKSFSNALNHERIILDKFLKLCKNYNVSTGTVYEIMKDYSKKN